MKVAVAASTWPLAAAQLDAGVRDCLLTYAFGWAENMVQAAIKSVPLGQTAGQRLLIRLRPLLLEPVVDEDAWAFSPLGSIAAMRHERLYTRIFRS